MRRLPWFVVVLLAACGGTAPPPVDADPDGIAFWHWHRDRALSVADEARLRAMGCDRIAELRGEVELTPDGTVRIAARGGQVAGCGEIARSAVLRLEASCHRALHDEGLGRRLAATIAARAPALGSCLQLDWDVPESRLAAYARWLALLRAQLPPGHRLEATGLVAWLDRDALDQVAALLDEFVVQVYHLAPPAADARAVHTARDPLTLLPRLERLPCAYRIGLASFEHLSATTAAGEPLAASLPLALESLLAAGAVVDATHDSGERVRHLRLPHGGRIGTLHFPAGTRFVHATIDPAWLGAVRARLQAAGTTRCRGLALFRLPAAGSLPCLSLDQIASGLAGRTRAASLDARFEADGGRWHLVLHNPGDRDLVEARALELELPSTAVDATALPPGWRLEALFAGRVVAPVRATACRIGPGPLRAGASVRLALDHRAAQPPGLRTAAW